MDTIRLDIVEIKHTQFFTKGLKLYIMSLILLIVTFFCLFNLKVENKIVGIVLGSLAMVSLLLAFVVPVVIGIRRTIIKEYLEVGKLLLNRESLTIFLDEKSDEYKLSDLKNISLNCNAVAGLPVGRGAGMTEGINNYIEFNYNEMHYKYRFLLKNYASLRILDDLILQDKLNIELFRHGNKVDRLIEKKGK